MDELIHEEFDRVTVENLRNYVRHVKEIRDVTMKFLECPHKQRVLRRVCGCVLCVGEANEAAVAKRWQCYASVWFRPGGKNE
jgi:hypothetical protein